MLLAPVLMLCVAFGLIYLSVREYRPAVGGQRERGNHVLAVSLGILSFVLLVIGAESLAVRAGPMGPATYVTMYFMLFVVWFLAGIAASTGSERAPGEERRTSPRLSDLRPSVSTDSTIG